MIVARSPRLSKKTRLCSFMGWKQYSGSSSIGSAAKGERVSNGSRTAHTFTQLQWLVRQAHGRSSEVSIAQRDQQEGFVVKKALVVCALTLALICYHRIVPKALNPIKPAAVYTPSCIPPPKASPPPPNTHSTSSGNLCVGTVHYRNGAVLEYARVELS